jgi:lipopolysaccharide transport system permease protein
MSNAVETGFELRGESSSIRRILRDLWASRDLIKMLARKDFFVRYRRASFGMIWVVALPLVQALVLAVIFGRLRRGNVFFLPPGIEVEIAVYLFAGLIPWSFFTATISSATSSIVDGGDLATKVYFPRIVLPLVTIASGIRGYLPTIAVLVALAAALGSPLGLDLLLLLPATVIMLGLSLGFALVLAPAFVYFRDMKYIVAASIFPWFWASGVIFPLERLGGLGKWLEINPAVGMIRIYRAAIGAAPPGWDRAVLISVVWIVVLIACALPLYRRYDRVFVDLM